MLGPGGVLVRLDHGAIDDVEVPVHPAGGINFLYMAPHEDVARNRAGDHRRSVLAMARC